MKIKISFKRRQGVIGATALTAAAGLSQLQTRG